MPYKFDTDKKIVGRENDKRIKLTPEQRKEIKQLYGKISQRKLAKMFNVSRRTIIFIGCPEKYKRNLQCRIDRGGSMIYYHPDTNTKYMKTHRQHKKALNEKNELKQGGNVKNIKQKCNLCKKFFVNYNGNRVYCYECSPQISIKQRGKK